MGWRKGNNFLDKGARGVRVHAHIKIRERNKINMCRIYINLYIYKKRGNKFVVLTLTKKIEKKLYEAYKKALNRMSRPTSCSTTGIKIMKLK